jgi:hypothetical protein
MYWKSCDPQIIDCNIAGNTAYVGGGIYGTGSTSLIQNCTVHDNFAGVSPNDVDANAVGQGGGIYSASMDSEIIDCIITDNEADASGGGIFFSGIEPSMPTVINCLVVDNLAGRDGGGLSANWYASPLITNCTIVSNEATGDFGVLGRTGFGGGIYSSYHSHSVILNSILWNNYALQGYELAVGTGFEYDPRPSTMDVSYSDVKGGKPFVFVDSGCTLNWDDGNNIQTDPCFVTGPLGSYYLSQIDTNDPIQTVDSCCVDAGNDLASNVGLSYPYTTRTDEVFDTNVVDMGYHYRLAHPVELCSFCDLSHDGDVDLVDFAIFSLHWLDAGCSSDNDWCDGADLTFDTHVNFEDLALLYDCWLAEDTSAPLPNPSKWKIAPYSTITSPYTISMTAETAFDSWGGIVEYYFECVTGNDNNSVWGPNTTYTTTGHPDPNVAYGYRVRAKDRRCIDHHYPIEMMIPGICDCNDPEDPNAPNKTEWSVIKYAVTAQEQQSVDNTPPTPYQMSWAVLPTATGSTSITMRATTADDTYTGGSNPVEYYFQCTDHGEANSVWQTDANYTPTGLTPSTLYTFRVRARDHVQQIPNDGTNERGNKNNWSDTASATTNAEQQENHGPENKGWATTPYEDTIGGVPYAHMAAKVTTDPEGTYGVQYYFQCVKYPDVFSGDCDNPIGFSSGWIDTTNWDVCLDTPGQGYRFRFKVRDTSPDFVESGWSSELPCYPP